MKVIGWIALALGTIWVIYGGLHVVVGILDTHGYEGGAARIPIGIATIGLGIMGIVLGVWLKGRPAKPPEA